MNRENIDPALLSRILLFQRSEITEYHIYTRVAESVDDQKNKNVLLRIAQEELAHYHLWKDYTGTDVAPDLIRVYWYCTMSRLLGITFTLKLMEHVEIRARRTALTGLTALPEYHAILGDEERHEAEIIALIDEERLKYVGSVVLGLNDALVEFTGTLAGFTFALQNTQLIAAAGLIMGVAASLSMGSSEYLSQRSRPGDIDPVKAALTTLFAYVSTVALLILPFLVFANPFAALGCTLLSAVLVILVYTFYLSVAKDLPFYRRFGEMLAISLGIAAISFVIGVLIRSFLAIDL
jgi:VIT1/CCC1 family predicted Fe2+/Mn2+ transporter